MWMWRFPVYLRLNAVFFMQFYELLLSTWPDLIQVLCFRRTREATDSVAQSIVKVVLKSELSQLLQSYIRVNPVLKG